MIGTWLKSHISTAAALVLAVALVGQTLRLHSAQMAGAHTALACSNSALTAERAARFQDKEYRDLEDLFREKTNAIDAKANKELEDARAAAARSGAAAGRLRADLAKYVAADRSRTKAATLAGQREASSDAVGVLADLFGRADDRAGKLAAIADDARIRGLACESFADAVK